MLTNCVGALKTRSLLFILFFFLRANGVGWGTLAYATASTMQSLKARCIAFQYRL